MPVRQKTAPSAPGHCYGWRMANMLAIGLLSSIPTPVLANILIPEVEAQSVNIVTVGSAAGLAAAIAQAQGPTQIVLASGNYGDIRISAINKAFDIVITSEDDSDRAIITGMVVSRSSRIRFDRINFSHQLKLGESTSTAGVFADYSNNINFSSCNFFGTLNDDPNDDGMLLRVRFSQDVVVFNSNFRQSRVSMFIEKSDNVSVHKNKFHQTREGINIEGTKLTYIEKNQFTDIAPNLAAGDHADAIQMWIGPSGVASSGLVVQANSFILNDAQTQGIFITGKTTSGSYHRSFLIRHNVYYGSMRQGIWIEDTRNVIIDRNTLIGATGFTYQPAVYLDVVNSANVTKNIAHFFMYQPGVTYTATANIDLSDTQYPAGPTAQSQMQGTVSGVDPALANFKVLPGSAAALAAAGAFIYSDIGIMTGSVSAVETVYQAELARVTAR